MNFIELNFYLRIFYCYQNICSQLTHKPPSITFLTMNYCIIVQTYIQTFLQILQKYFQHVLQDCNRCIKALFYLFLDKIIIFLELFSLQLLGDHLIYFLYIIHLDLWFLLIYYQPKSGYIRKRPTKSKYLRLLLKIFLYTDKMFQD